MSARVSIGARGRRFTLELPLETPDGFGGSLRSYQPGPELWGSLEALSTRERVAAGRPELVASHFRDGVSAAMRLSLGSRRFRIKHAVDPDGRRRSLEILCEEVTP